MDKYYTPSIEEFYVGFEYEELIGTESNGIQDWSEKIYDPEEHIDSYGEYTFKELFPSCVRVKYLDKEDIESLGFRKVKDYSACDVYQKHNENNNIWYELEYYNEDYNNELLIEKYELSGSKDYSSTYIFQGTIKNKSELKKVLKMLNIL